MTQQNDGINRTQEGESSMPRISQVVASGLKDPMFYRLYILGLLLVFCSLFYYFGEIVDYFKWDSLRFDIFYTVHDMHRLLFLAPILYAARVFGIRASLIVTLVSGGIWMPRALFISPYSFPVLRAVFTLVVEGITGTLMAMSVRQNRKIERLEKNVRADRDRLLDILRRMTDGVAIVGPDYRVRFVNEAMKKEFGDGEGLPCYKYIYHDIEPCSGRCHLQEVLAGATARWEYSFPNGTTYEVVASPCVDASGVNCQLATYRNITHLKKAQMANSLPLSNSART